MGEAVLDHIMEMEDVRNGVIRVDSSGPLQNMLRSRRLSQAHFKKQLCETGFTPSIMMDTGAAKGKLEKLVPHV